MIWTLMPLFLAAVLCSAWEVESQQQHICAVKGSSVVIPCSFHHPGNLKVKRVMWGHVRSRRFISYRKVGNVTSRFQYIGDNHHNCSLKINQVKHNDAGKYAVKFILNNKKATWSQKAGPTLKVVDLKILVTKPHGNRTTKEGDSVNLTCINACDGGHLSSAFTWFKNREAINEGPGLYLSKMSSTDSGNYTCSLKTHTGTRSGVVNVDVEHGPKNTSVSIRPSMEVDAGGNITLICSSHANPPVENYTWFKIDDDHITTVGHQPVFVCGDGGRYFCSATNTHGSQNSTDVTLKIRPCWATFVRDTLIILTVAVLLIAITVVAVTRLNRKRKWAPKTDCAEDIQNTDYVNWLICDNNQSQEGRDQREGETEVIYATINFNMRRKSNTEQPADSRDYADAIYSTVRRSRPSNPSYIEPP